MPRGSKALEMPEWALQITSLREHLGINQAELARRLACSAMTISRWERGLLQPSAEHFIQLGNLGNKTRAWFFWEMAGIQPAKMAGALKSVSGARKSEEIFRKGAGGSNSNGASGNKFGSVQVPLLKSFVGTHGVMGDKRSLRTIPATELVSVPAKWCPNPDYTSLIRVRGSAMEPLIHDGDMVAVDSFQSERESLYGKPVVMINQASVLLLANLRRYDTVDVLQSEDPEHEPVILKADKWRIVGKVLWWISHPAR